MPHLTLDEYLGPWKDHPDATEEVRANALRLITAVSHLLDDLMRNLIYTRVNPKTGSIVSGETGGGFRPQDYPVGAPRSAHKTGEAVDLFDPFNSIAGHLQMRPDLIRKHGLWMEHPSATIGWCHLQIRPVKSGNTIFQP